MVARRWLALVVRVCSWKPQRQLQQELLTFRAQVQIAEAVRAINNLATAHVRKDTPTLIDVKGFGRLKEFPGSEDVFTTVGKEDGGNLRWSDQGVRDDVGAGC